MLTVDNALKTIYKNDYFPMCSEIATKRNVFSFPELNLVVGSEDNSQVVQGTYTLTESICSEDNLNFGACESSVIDVQLANVDDSIIGKKMVVTQVVNGTYTVPMGTYTVESCELVDNTIFKKVTAKDSMTIFNVDVASWYNSIDWTTINTIKKFRISLYTHLGIIYEDVTLCNDSMPITKTIYVNELNGLKVLKCIMQINGCFGHFDRSNTLRHIILPLATESSSETITKGLELKSIKFQDYTVHAIDKVKITQEDADADNDIGGIYGTGTNCYTISGNFLTYGWNASQMATASQNVSANIFNRAYKPILNSDSIGLPYVECGDKISCVVGDNTYSTYVLRRILNVSSMQDNYVANGDEILSTNVSRNVEIERLKGKMNVVKRTVEEYSSSITEMQGEIYGLLPHDGLLPSETLLPCENVLSALTDQYNTQFRQTSREINMSVSEVQQNVNALSATVTLNANSFTTQINNLSTDTSTQLEQLENEISLRVTKTGLCNELNLSTDGLNFTGNRFTWSATNSSMTADGTLTCNNITATNGTFSGTITGSVISSSKFTSDGDNGEMTLYDGYLSFFDGNYNGYLSSNGLSFSATTNLVALDVQHFKIQNSSNVASITPSTMSATYGAFQYLSNVDTINGGTPITSSNYTNYVTNISKTTDISANLWWSSAYTGTACVTFSNTSGDTNVPTIGWVKARQDSDERLKENFSKLDIEKEYLSLQTYEYKFKDGVNNDKVHFGFKAQEVAEKFYPNMYDLVEFDNEIVTEGEKQYVKDGVYRLNYENMHAMHVYMIQKQQKEIDCLKQALNEIKLKID